MLWVFQKATVKTQDSFQTQLVIRLKCGNSGQIQLQGILVPEGTCVWSHITTGDAKLIGNGGILL